MTYVIVNDGWEVTNPEMEAPQRVRYSIDLQLLLLKRKIGETFSQDLARITANSGEKNAQKWKPWPVQTALSPGLLLKPVIPMNPKRRAALASKLRKLMDEFEELDPPIQCQPMNALLKQLLKWLEKTNESENNSSAKLSGMLSKITTTCLEIF
ncbi:hypothetical protein CEXT_670211 [Caerostris extrusa]|uniref:Uncharacterized protein n=1 Tax=Caerostris extrusa TaxID=172846 RepID=A0AAV4P7H4_CAEEX|nr:hypothetical protein CEXT_670211 [Caerostris extrusa]